MTPTDRPIADRRAPLSAAIRAWAFAIAVAATLLLGVGHAPAPGVSTVGALAPAEPAPTAMAVVAASLDGAEAGLAFDPLDTLDGLNVLDEGVDTVALAYADVAPASAHESPPEALLRELRADAERVAVACRERGPSPGPGAPSASCDVPAPASDSPQIGAAPAGSLAFLNLRPRHARPAAPSEPAGVHPTPLLRPPAA